MSEDPTNIQMWSLYSNNHEGICIAFSIDWNFVIEHAKNNYPNMEEKQIIEEMKNEGIRFDYTHNNITYYFGFQKVKYVKKVSDYPVNEYIKAHFDSAKDEKINFSWALTETKHNKWSYENEWRLVSLCAAAHLAKGVLQNGIDFDSFN